MPVNLANYINICSNAVLSAVDNETVELKDVDGIYHITVNKQLKEVLYFNIKSLCKGYYQFGANNIIINSCIPCNNWRTTCEENIENISNYKYVLTHSEVFYINEQPFHEMLESIWKALWKDLHKFIFLDHPKLDCFDLNMIIHKKITDNITVHPNNYYFLTDPNNEFLHDDDVPRWIQTDIEIEMRKNKLIL